MSAINIAEVLDEDFVETIAIRRPTPAMQEGVAVATNVDGTISANVQPTTAAELKKLPEGDRLTDVITVYSRSLIRCTPDVQDIIVYGGKSYRAIKAEDWSAYGYYIAYCEGFTP